MGAKLAALIRVQPTFKQRAQDGRVYFRPIQGGNPRQQLDIRKVQRQRGIIIEQAAIESGHGGEINFAAGVLHGAEQAGSEIREARRIGLGGMRLPRWEETVKQLVELGRVKKAADAASLFSWDMSADTAR